MSGFDPGAFRAGQRRGNKDVTTIDPGEDAAPDPAVTRKLAAALPEITRALVRMTVSRESLDPDALRAAVTSLGESAALSRSLLEQLDGWVQREQAGGRLEWEAPGIPAERLATVAGIRLRVASSAAGELAGFLGWAQVVLADLRAAGLAGGEAPPVADDFDCEAYGPGGRALGAVCFVSGALNSRTCGSPAECHEVMAAERQRVFDRIREGAAAGDPDMAYLAGQFTSPDQLLGGGGHDSSEEGRADG